MLGIDVFGRQEIQATSSTASGPLGSPVIVTRSDRPTGLIIPRSATRFALSRMHNGRDVAKEVTTKNKENRNAP